MSKHGPLRNLAEYALAWPVLKCLEWLPLAAARLEADALSSVVYMLTPGWRRVAETNLRLAFPEADAVARDRIIRGTYRNLGRVALAVARMSRLNAGNISDWIRYEGFEHFEAALAKGNGVLFMTAHLGNWELSAFAHALFGHPMHVMVRPLDNPWLDRLIEARRASCGNRTIRKQDSARRVFQLLRRNEAVGILVDQNAAGDDGVFVDFFGVRASATAGLAKVAMRTGAAVIPGFAFWKPSEKRYVLRFYPPLEMAPGEDGEAAIVANTQKCQGFLEDVIRAHPDQWLWIHRRWKTRPQGEPPLY
jgi:KDO2-lipid IV(A) lauroyltransferase